MPEFRPPLGLQSPHLQTLLARVPTRAGNRHGTCVCSEDAILDCRDGIRLEAKVTPGTTAAPWSSSCTAGSATTDPGTCSGPRACFMRAATASPACCCATTAAPPRTIARCSNSARLGEVVDACNALAEGCDAVGVVGFSLGGNFALRLAGDPGADASLRACLAVSPVIDPAGTVRAIDAGWVSTRSGS